MPILLASVNGVLGQPVAEPGLVETAVRPPPPAFAELLAAADASANFPGLVLPEAAPSVAPEFVSATLGPTSRAPESVTVESDVSTTPKSILVPTSSPALPASPRRLPQKEAEPVPPADLALLAWAAVPPPPAAPELEPVSPPVPEEACADEAPDFEAPVAEQRAPVSPHSSWFRDLYSLAHDKVATAPAPLAGPSSTAPSRAQPVSPTASAPAPAVTPATAITTAFVPAVESIETALSPEVPVAIPSAAVFAGSSVPSPVDCHEQTEFTQKNQGQVADSQHKEGAVNFGGTEKAKEAVAMSSSAPLPPPAAAATAPRRGDEAMKLPASFAGPVAEASTLSATSVSALNPLVASASTPAPTSMPMPTRPPVFNESARIPAVTVLSPRRAVETVKLATSSSVSSTSTAAEPSVSASASSTTATPNSPVSVLPSPTPTLTSSPLVNEIAPAATPVPVAAVRMIERVAEVAERVASRPSEQVKISLDLEGSHRVEVKVAMRGGRVFADFRTDSVEMRAALTQAWDGFVRGREASAQRWADPVFSALGASSVSAPEVAPVNLPAQGAVASDSSSRQDAAADQRQAPRRELPAEPGAFAFASSSSSHPAPASSAPVSPRPDPSRLLSALA